MREIWSICWNFREFSADGQESEIIVVRILRSSPELWVKCAKSGRFAGISMSSLPMVRHLKTLIYSGSINGANFTSFVGFWGELHEICIIHWRFCQKKKLLLVNLKTKKQMCMVKPYYILAERFGLFAVRLSSLSWGKGLLGCGITFDIFTHGLHGSFFCFINLWFTKKRIKKENTC